MMKKHTTIFQFRPDGIKSLLLMLLLLMMTVGATGAWGKDYSGTYFIANGNGYSSTNAANNFYLVPATNANYATDQPHLTTSMTGQVLNCCWQIVKNGDYYRIIHVADGKYLTANPAMDGTSGNDVGRLRVHLQEFADIAADTDGNTLFEIKVNSNGGYNIRHIDMADKINNSTTTYLDPAGGNVDGTNLTSVRTASTSNGKVNVGGGIGYWTDEAAARWQFEAVPQNNTYTYNIVDRQGNIAIKYTTGANQPAAKALSSYTDIPAAIRSPYLNGETVKFYTFSGAFDADNLTDENKIAATPVTNNANIYVTYTTDHLSEKFLRLQGKRAFNIDDSGCIYDNGGSLGTGGGSPTVTTTTHLWYISGNDPYAVQIKNLSTGNYLVSSALPTLSLAASATNNFILMEESAAANAAYESMSLMVATGNTYTNDPTKAVNAYPVSSNVTYHLIDKAGTLIVSVPSTSSELALPGEWVSPLVSEYQYYKDATLSGTAVGSSCDFTGATTVTSPFEVGSGGDIYVTYDVSNAIDITGGKSYLLKFSDGVSFNQENGSDGINTTSTKAVYPYNNGDFNLYVYGQEEWVKQLANGASTRTRWLWKIVSSHNGMLLTGSDIDPYHVVIKSHQNQSLNSGTYAGSTYLRTYKPNNEVGVITGVTYENLTYPDSKPDLTILSPTEYMILGTSMLNMKLMTYNEVEGTRQTVTNFEQYWKNNPTARDILNAADKSVGAQPVTYELSSDQKALLTAKGWHTYECWANAAPWSNTSTGGKTLANGNHWFQTISMGSGNFTVEEVSLTPQVILLDQHGWEIMRMPMYTDNDFTVVNTEGLSKYNSPMVSEYQWYPSAAKVTGYHKYNISDPAPEINIYENSANPANNNKVEWHIVGSESFTSNSLAVTPDGNLTGYSGQDKKYKTDFYVTYTVKSEYDNAYTGAATSDAAVPSAYLLKQGGSYASTNGSAITATAAPASMEDIPNVMQWNLQPNFDIDREMGYKYAGETGAQEGAKSKEDTDQDNYDEGRNGFDPYNVQIQSAAYPLRYFTANTTGIALDGGAWKGTSDAVNLQNLNTKQTADGYDQTKLNITNATFMVVDDGAGNMRLMPRFDNSKVVTFSSTPFKTLETQTTAATTGDKGTGTQTLWLELVPKALEIHSSSEITEMNGHYLLAQDFAFDEGFTSLGTSDQPFRGIIDGQLNTISGTTSTPLVAYADGAIIRNVILEEVGISTGTNVGAICCEATGATRIYNCGILGGSVGGSGDVGGIVGSLDGSARVINCYSYATITGGNNVGGIVGNNKGTTTASSINTMVMNCMFYGDISGGNTVSPVFGGNNIANLQGGLNTFNYYAYDKLKTKAISDNKYNSALAVEEKYLNRFEFYRLLLNSNKKLAAFYATGDVANADQMAKWVLETADRTIANPKPYPILKAQGYYPSIINIDAENAPSLILENDKPREEDRKKGGKLGKTLSVTIATSKSGDGGGQTWPSGASVTTTSLTLQRTDKDFDRFNYNYDKVQLPYYNDVGTGNYTDNRVVTGWKITAITPVADDPYTADNYPTTGVKNFPDHNYADRKSSNKDLYSVSKRVFSQGAYFDVPYGVTSITIEPYWGKAHYIADPNYDVVYKTDYKNENKQNVTQTGTQVANPTGTTPTMFIGQKVETSIERALNNINNNMSGWGPTVYDNALVLVGNLHLATVPQNGTTPFTMMSVDEDNDHEPDYSLIYHHIGRSSITPIRFDFLNIPGTAQAQKPNGASLICNFTIFKTRGWFEVTNTALFYTSQLEYENLDNNTKTDAPLILLGGVVDQFVSTQSKTVTGKTIYIHVGGNVWIKEFGMGTHSDGSESTPHVPVSVTGGEFPGFYLTGTYKADAKVRSDDAECYISGGYFHEVAGASLEQIDGNVHWQIYNADIDNFFGGGINDAKPIKGDIITDIYNSHVTLFCGGPKFGNMQPDKTVTTTAEGCTFEKFFGAGYGGTSIAKKKYYDKDGDQDWSTLQGYYTTDRGKYFDGTNTGSSQISGKDYGKKGPGVATDFDYEFFVWTSGATGARLYVKFASFSLAQCNDVSSTLKKCTVENDFYGGGNLGKVVGTATSVLEDCTIKGSVYGAGYSASLPTVEVRDEGFTKNPKYNSQSGMFEPGVFSGTTIFTWQNATEAGVTLENGQSGSDLTNHILYTNTALTTLGQVKNSNLIIKGATTVSGDVYGGGALASMDEIGQTKVTLLGGTINGNVYGGGMGQLATAAVGTPGMDGYVPAKEDVEAKVGSTQVNLNGMDATEYKEAYSSWGLVTEGEGKPYTVANTARGCVVGGSIFGCNNINGTPLGDATVHVYKTQNANATQIGNDGDVTNAKEKGRYDLTAVYGGGNLAPFIPAAANESTASTHVIIDGCDLTSIETVYGGGNAASTPATDVTVKGTFEIKELFGGGNGLTVLPDGRPNPGANVGYKNYTIYEQDGDVWKAKDDPYYDTKEERTAEGSSIVYGTGAANVNINGGTVHAVFGGSNTKGNVRISAVTLLEDQDVCEFCVDEAYGGGKSAPMDAEAKLLMACIPGLKAAYGGAEAANIEGDVTLTITNGTFDRVFGGNNISGTISGKITVNIEETGCRPVVIGELYGGGNLAAYSIYGYNDDGTPKESGENPFDNPEVNVRSCTSIGAVYGGGYGTSAKMIASPTVNINESVGSPDTYPTTGDYDDNGFKGKTITLNEGKPNEHTVTLPAHKKGEMGAIGNIFGGGNAAEVKGNTNVNVGTSEYEEMVSVATGDDVTDYYTRSGEGTEASPYTYTEATGTAVEGTTYYQKVKGANITGNVYGGGNNAEVTGDTHVVIGEKYEAPSTPTPNPSPTPEP